MTARSLRCCSKTVDECGVHAALEPVSVRAIAHPFHAPHLCMNHNCCLSTTACSHLGDSGPVCELLDAFPNSRISQHVTGAVLKA